MMQSKSRSTAKAIRYIAVGDHSILTSFSAVAIALSSAIVFEVKITWDFILLTVLLVLAIYLFDSTDGGDDLHPNESGEKNPAVAGKGVIVALTSIFVIGCLIISWFHSSLVGSVFLVFLIVAGLLYPLLFKKLTRKMTGFKDLYVAGVWNLGVAYFFVYYRVHLSAGVLFFLVLVFLRDLMNVSYCDVKDEAADRSHGLRTYAVVLGAEGLRILLMSLNIVSVAVIILGVRFSLFPSLTLGLLLPVIAVLLVTNASFRRGVFRSHYVDLEYYLWLVILSLMYFRVPCAPS